MTTIRELAKLTGYSTSMISRVLNRYPYVDEQKRNEILKAIAETNYRPNSMARNLSLGKTQNIGVIVPYVHMPYFEQISKGIFEEAFRQNYKVTLLPTKHEQKIEKQYLEEFATKLYDGLIITSRANPLKKFLNINNMVPLFFVNLFSKKIVLVSQLIEKKPFLILLLILIDIA